MSTTTTSIQANVIPGERKGVGLRRYAGFYQAIIPYYLYLINKEQTNKLPISFATFILIVMSHQYTITIYNMCL